VKNANVIEAVTVEVGGTPTNRAGVDEVLLTRKQVARRQQTTPETLISWEKQGLLKPIRLGSLVRYRLSDILAFEKRGESAVIVGKRPPNRRIRQSAVTASSEEVAP
jgi:hypothetical protein